MNGKWEEVFSSEEEKFWFWAVNIIFALLILAAIVDMHNNANKKPDMLFPSAKEKAEYYNQQVKINEEEAKEYEKTHPEVINIFETYNENYVNETDKNSRKIFIIISQDIYEQASTILNNYISHVNGEITSVESRTGYYTDDLYEGQMETIIKEYTILVPPKALYADYLQNTIDDYLKYIRQKNFANVKETY